MNSQQVTITLPQEIYERVNKQSQLMHRSVADQLVEVVISSVQEQENLPTDIEQELAKLKLFNDEELWQAARITAPPEKEERIQELLDKQQLEGLSDSEKQEADNISHFFNRIMLVRAEAAVLLKERGYEINQHPIS